MDLYLIRHADALPVEAANTGSDAERPLSAAGQDQARALADGLCRRGVRLQYLVTSPLVRAQQTAEGVRTRWSEEEGVPEVRVCDDLAPGGKRKRLIRFLGGLGAEAVGLVGHQPDLGEFAGWLLGHRKKPLDLAKAGVALIRCENGPGKGRGTLVWMVTPDWLTP
jgi:phosphohistidine phosphatase